MSEFDEAIPQEDGVELETQEDPNLVEDNEVEDLLETDDVEDTVAPAAAEGEKPKAEKVVKEKVRGDLPPGIVTPIGLCKELNVRRLGRDKHGNEKDLKPQEVYSYIKNAPKEHAFPLKTGVKDSLGKDRENVLDLEEGIAWWIAKNERTEARRTNAANKAAAKAEKAAAKPAETSAPATEEAADDVDLSDFAEAEQTA